MHAELIIKGASVVTMNPDQPRAQAVAVAEGKILAVGSDADIVEMIGPATRVVDAKGATLSPGFVEAHMHVFGGGASLGHLQLTGMKGAAMIRAAVQAHALAQPDAKVLYAQGADYDMLDGAAFDRHLLDSMVADRPLAIVTFDHHTMWVNTKALEVTGLLQGKTLGPGNEIVMGA
ncbi:amidohydrolase family protein, partial [Pseudophaeobacter arcticus]